MAEHEAILQFGGYYVPSPQLACHAPADAMCHAVWTCDCETVYDAGVRNGVPAHRPDYDDPDTWHAGTFDPTYCNLRDWFKESDECLFGTVAVPVEATWEVDFYNFELVPEPGGSEPGGAS